MDRFIYHNDGIVEAGGAALAPTLGGVLYGWGVFTTLRIYNGAVFAFDRHWERLLKHAEKARLPVPLEKDKIESAIAQLIEANRAIQGRARVTILKGDTGSWRITQGREAEVLIFTTSEPARPQTEIAITVSPHRLLSSSPLAGVKRTAMLENLLALEEARARDFTEAVMLNERGEIVSATAANIFWVEGDELITPSIGTGCVAGVTRAYVYEIARRMGVHLVEGGFPLQRLLDARELFLTSTAREIAPVESFDIKRYNRKQARVTRLISREFQKLTRNARIKA